MSLVGRMGERGSAFYREREVDEGSAREERDDRSLQWGRLSFMAIDASVSKEKK